MLYKPMLHKISDQELEDKLKSLVQEERDVQLQVLKHLEEVERRLLFAKRAYSSLFEYCTKCLGYSEAAAQRRIDSMRLLKKHPEYEQKFISGALNLTTLSLARSVFRRAPELSQKEILVALEYKSKREAEKILAKYAPKAMAAIQSKRAEQAKQMAGDCVELNFLADPALLAQLEQAQIALGLPVGTSLRELVEAMANKIVKNSPRTNPKMTRTRRLLPPAETTRYIPVADQKFVWRRDEGMCQHIDPITGRKCGSKYHLQIHHIQAFALGGPSTPENLQLLCANHNQLLARQDFPLLNAPRRDFLSRRL